MGPRIYLRGAMTFVLNIGGAIPRHSFASFTYWSIVTTQDFIKFWGKIFVFVLLEMIEFSQGFKTF
jgi:hypothetical protein